jgi:hypothetical protein
MNVVGIANLVAGLGGVAAILALVVLAFRGDPARADEDEARRHFDEHGYWPEDGSRGRSLRERLRRS